MLTEISGHIITHFNLIKPKKQSLNPHIDVKTLRQKIFMMSRQPVPQGNWLKKALKDLFCDKTLTSMD